MGADPTDRGSPSRPEIQDQPTSRVTFLGSLGVSVDLGFLNTDKPRPGLGGNPLPPGARGPAAPGGMIAATMRLEETLTATSRTKRTDSRGACRSAMC